MPHTLLAPVARTVRGGSDSEREQLSFRTAEEGAEGEEEESERKMAAAGLGVKAAPFTYAAHALAAVAAVLVLVWCVHFRGGLALESQNKNLIFNVSHRHRPPILLLPCFPPFPFASCKRLWEFGTDLAFVLSTYCSLL